MMEMKNKAVVLGANYYIALSVMRNLGKHKIDVVALEYSNKGLYASKSKYCKEVVLVPHYKKETEAFIEALVDYGEKQPYPPVLFPCADPYVEVIDAHLDRLKEVFLIHDIKKGLLTQLLDKGSLEKLARAHQVLLPETYQVDDLDLLSKITYPCLVKPTNSAEFVKKFRKKMFQVSDEGELKEAIAKSKKAKLEVIVQRIISGFDDHMYTFDAYLNAQSQITHYLTCQKWRQFPINFGASVYTEQRHVEGLYQAGASFLETIGYKGFAEIEFKKDAKTDEFYLIEVNVRLSNLNEVLARAGVNMPYLTYMELIGQPIRKSEEIVDSKLMFRYLFEDLLAIKGYIKTGQLTWQQVLSSLFRRKVYAIFSWQDIWPALVFWQDILKKVFHRRKARK